jgi:hypothetical protein
MRTVLIVLTAVTAVAPAVEPETDVPAWVPAERADQWREEEVTRLKLLKKVQLPEGPYSWRQILRIVSRQTGVDCRFDPGGLYPRLKYQQHPYHNFEGSAAELLAREFDWVLNNGFRIEGSMVVTNTDAFEVYPKAPFTSVFDAYRVLRDTPGVSSGVIGGGAHIPRVLDAFDYVMDSPHAEQVLAKLLETGRPAGRIFALAGLADRRPELVEAEKKRLVESSHEIVVFSGCVKYSCPVNLVLESELEALKKRLDRALAEE